MPNLEIPYDDGLLAALEMTREEFENEARFLLAAKLFDLRQVSTGQAAKMAGMPKIHFMDKLNEHGIPVVKLDEDQIQRELGGLISG